MWARLWRFISWGWGGWTAHSGPTYTSAGTLGPPIYYIPVSWTTHSSHTYMLAGTLGVSIYLSLLAGLLISSRTYSVGLLAGPLVVVTHICWLACLSTHIFIPVGWTTHSGHTYMLAGTFGSPIYFIPVGWTTNSGTMSQSVPNAKSHLVTHIQTLSVSPH